MIRSFGLRLALLSALVSGLALLAFGGGAWWLIRKIKFDHLEQEVRNHAERAHNESLRAARQQGNIPPLQLGREEWARIEARMAETLGVRDPLLLVLRVEDQQGRLIYQSSHWPAELSGSPLPWPADSELGREAQNHPDISFQPLPGLINGVIAGVIASAQAAEPEVPFPPGEQDRAQGNGFPPDRPPPPWAREGRPPPGPWGAPRREELDGLDVAPQGGSGSNRLPAADQAPLPAARPGPPPVSRVATLPAARGQWHLGLASTGRARIAVGVHSSVIDGDMAGIRNGFLAALPLALLLVGAGSWLFSRRALRPLRALTDAAREIGAEGLDQRLAAAGADPEFAELIIVFNHMLERLERSFRQARRFSADAAHELKTPLAILQGQLERAIAQADTGSAMQAELVSILDEVRRLSTISRKLLLLSQADSGRLALHREAFDLSACLEELLEDTRMLAPALAVRGEIPPNLVVEADAQLLRQVLHNLISNAIKYNVADPNTPPPAGAERGWVSISAQSTGGPPAGVEITVANASGGISRGARERLFERFYRGDPARNRQVDGVGLGLSLSREIARAHGGDVLLLEAGAGQVVFALRLPWRAPPPRAA